MTALTWKRNERREWVAPPETAVDMLDRIFSTPHTIEERLRALADFALAAAEHMGMQRRPPAPPADFAGDEWPPDAGQGDEPRPAAPAPSWPAI